MGLMLVLLSALMSCEKPVLTVEEGNLSFSRDTIKFDSIFVNFLTPTERLTVLNNTNKNIKVSRIWLEAGDDTRFSMIVNGQLSNDVRDVIVAEDDSILVFINLESELRDDFVEEFLLFQVGEDVQRVPISAFILDAYLLRSRFRNDSITGFFFDKDTVLTPDKPIVMDGPIIIPENVTVDILPGTHIFFTPYKIRANQSESSFDTLAFFSQLFISGTLRAVGTPDAKIIFEGSRLEDTFRELPAQWRGINFSINSKDNILEHVEIKNAQFGVRVDSTSINDNPKVRIRYSEIKNMGAYGIWGVGFSPDVTGAPMIEMENSIVNTCKERTAFLWGGGNYEFYNCTFANFNLINFSRRSPQILITDYRLFDNTAIIAPGNAQFDNCAIWGSEENEITLDLLGGVPYDLNFDHCLIRYRPDNEVDITPFISNEVLNQDPNFNDQRDRDYRPSDNSPLRDAGKDLSARFMDDFRNRPDSLRQGRFDIGAWEYYPFE